MGADKVIIADTSDTTEEHSDTDWSRERSKHYGTWKQHVENRYLPLYVLKQHFTLFKSSRVQVVDCRSAGVWKWFSVVFVIFLNLWLSVINGKAQKLKGQFTQECKFSHSLLTCMPRESQVKFHRPQNFNGSSQQGSVLLNNWRSWRRV